MPMQLNTVNQQQQATLNTNQNSNNMMMITAQSPFAQNNTSINSQQPPQHPISHVIYFNRILELKECEKPHDYYS